MIFKCASSIGKTIRLISYNIKNTLKRFEVLLECLKLSKQRLHSAFSSSFATLLK